MPAPQSPAARVSVSLHLRRPGQRRLDTVPAGRRHARALAAAPADVAAVRAFARGGGLRVSRTEPAARIMVLAGTRARVTAAFGASATGPSARGRVPRALAGVVLAVCGHGGRAAVRPHFQVAAARIPKGQPPDLAHYTPPQVARWYKFPEPFDGRGQTIALLECAGGFRRADIQAYFSRLRIPVPRITVVSVHGARNRPVGGVLTADTEVCLDIEVAGSVAPGTRLVVYFAPNTEAGFLAGVKAAVHDRRHRPSFLSISWGGAEPTWSRPAMRVLDEVFEDAARLGITVVASSGDQGPSDGTGRRHAVDFPASSPHVLACGGTRLLIRNGVARESMWNDGADGWGEAGGGRSAVFPRPGYQAWVRFGRSAPHPGRAVPDVSADADPETGYLVRVNGHWIRTAGTSAVAPLWAALLARCAQALGRPVGPLHELLYSPKGRRMLTPVQAGRAHRGRRWYPATGLGTPDGRRLLDALRLHLV